MKILLLITALLLINSSILFAQKADENKKEDPGRVIVMMKTQLNFPDFHFFQDINDQIVTQLPFDAKVVDDFPVSPVYKFDINWKEFNSFIISITGFWHSTGSRIHYEDYSGEYHSDIIVNATGFGFGLTKFFAMSNSPMQLGLTIDFGFFEKDYRFEDYTRIGNEDNTQKDSYLESGMYTEPGFILAYVNDNFLVGLNFGYMLDLNSSNAGGRAPLISYNSGRIGLVFGLNSNIFK
ncbi:MAG: hypothetical protein KAH48_09160 [Chlorobi bacterium]|nr:hypothetical protein [Chlorobiota bacterium]